jgi:hypothetical protein
MVELKHIATWLNQVAMCFQKLHFPDPTGALFCFIPYKISFLKEQCDHLE